MIAVSYFTFHLFRDWKWWAKIGFAGLMAVNTMDVISAGLAPPGYFSLWVVRVTVVSGIAGLVIYYLYQSRRDKKNRRIEQLLPILAAERRAFIETKKSVDPKFQTFCFECCHYDAGRRSCSLRLHDRAAWIKLNTLETYTYCLYWNLRDHPILALTERVFQAGREKPPQPPDSAPPA